LKPEAPGGGDGGPAKFKLPPGSGAAVGGDILAAHQRIAELGDALKAEMAKARDAAEKELDAITAAWLRATGDQEAILQAAADEHLATLREMRDAGVITEEEWAEGVRRVHLTLFAELDELERARTETAREEAEERARIAREEAQELRDQVAGTLAEIRSQFMEGSDDLVRIAQAALGDLAGSLFEFASGSLFDLLAGSILGGGLGGGAGIGVGGGSFGGGAPDFTFGLAAGGTVKPNVPVLVGERGPELFVPSGAGTIVPNDRLVAGPGVTVNQTFVVNEGATEGAVRMLAATAGEIKRQTIAAVVDGQRRTAGAMLG
ncbi:MAG: hypothetical protein ACREER_09745, partial [Alphaproteobacteria bacterium]